MPGAHTPVFFVDPRSEPVVVRVRGRASMHNTHLLKQYLDRAIDAGRRRFALDFSECDGVDSTFLGTVKGVATRLHAARPAGSIVLCRLGGRNLDNVRMVGLDCLAIVDCDVATSGGEGGCHGEALEGSALSREELRALVLKAHESLSDDPGVRSKFQDVLTLLKEEGGR